MSAAQRVEERLLRASGPPLKPLTLRGNFAWTAVGNAVYSLCSWLMLTVIAKHGDPAMVGQFSLSLAVAQPVMMFTQLSLNQVQATDARREYRFGDYLGLRLITNALAMMALVGIALGSGYPWQTAAVIIITGFGLACDAVGDIVYGLQRQHERMDRIAISMAAGGALSLLLLTGGLVFLHSIVWAAAGSALASLLVLVTYNIPNAVFLLRASEGGERDRLLPALFRYQVPRPHGDPRTLGRLAWLAFPLGTIMVLLSLNSNLSRYFVAHYLGMRALGIFSALLSFVTIGRLLTSALGLSASPRLARYYAEGDRNAFLKLLQRLLLLGAVVGLAAPLVALVAGKQILTVFYTAEYARYRDVFVLYLAAGGLSYVDGCIGWAITAARCFRAQAVSLAALTVVTAATSVWLIPAHGLRGAAWSAMAVSIAQLGCNLLILRQALNPLAAPKPLDKEIFDKNVCASSQNGGARHG